MSSAHAAEHHVPDEFFRSFGSRTSSTDPISATLSQFAASFVCSKSGSSPCAPLRIAGLDKDTHLHGNQFNTALAGKLCSRSYSVTILIREARSLLCLVRKPLNYPLHALTICRYIIVEVREYHRFIRNLRRSHLHSVELGAQEDAPQQVVALPRSHLGCRHNPYWHCP